MPMSRRSQLTAAILIAVPAALGPAAPAVAAPPQLLVVHVDETFPSRTSETCGFEIIGHVEGTMRFVDFVDGAGDVVRSLVTYPSLRYTYINAESGESVSSRSPDPEHITWDADGGFTMSVTGLVMHWVVPGEGVVAAQSGHFVITVGPDGEASESTPSGRHDDYHAAMCQILAP